MYIDLYKIIIHTTGQILPNGPIATTRPIQDETIIGKNLFMPAVGARGAYGSYFICLTIRHTFKSRLAG